MSVLEKEPSLPYGGIINGSQSWAIMPGQDVELRDEKRSFHAVRMPWAAMYGKADEMLGFQIQTDLALNPGSAPYCLCDLR